MRGCPVATYRPAWYLSVHSGRCRPEALLQQRKAPDRALLRWKSSDAGLNLVPGPSLRQLADSPKRFNLSKLDRYQLPCFAILAAV